MATSSREDILIEDLAKRLEKYLNPLATLNSNDYLELARLLLKLYLDNEQDLHKTLEILMKFTVNVIKDMYRDTAKRRAIEKLCMEAKPRLKLYKNWLSVGIQIVGLEAHAILTDDLVLQMLLGTIPKLLLLVAVEVQKYASYRYIRKVAVAVEELSRRLKEKLMSDELSNIFLQALERAREKIRREEVFLNTPEVIVLADRLRKLREDILYSL